jgi:signal transduction histidine kinase
VTAKRLKVLMVEDSEPDAQLLARRLRQGGFDVVFERVDTKETMVRALGTQQWDLVVSDYSMPRFDAPAALLTLQERGLDIPFIIISGTMREEQAALAMRSGAHDFFVKNELGPRLFAAIEREVHEAQVRASNLKMQEQLLISDCMASMGTLAAGIAHEINNPLASVIANIDLASAGVNALMQTAGSSKDLQEVTEELGDVREAAERIRSIVRDLRIFSRPEAAHNDPVSIPKVMDSTLRMAWNEIRHRARLVKNYGETPLIDLSESRLGQVFLNLVINAAQAIAEGSSNNNTITITTSTDRRGQAVIEIADTGPGMSQELVNQVWKPFFTTKPVGVGTGLGLTICQRIVRDMGGSIELESELGKGTTFRIVLPPATGAGSDDKSSRPSQLSSRRARVLVVDDEPMIGKAVRRALSKEHDVLATNTALDALKSIRAGERFDVILCDLLMPQMTGMDFYDELLRDVPDQASRVIFLTGGAFTPRAQSFLTGVQNQRIEKPFDPIHLRALINDRLR